MRFIIAFPITLILKSCAVITNNWQAWGVAIILSLYVLYAITFDVLHYNSKTE